MIDRVTGWFEIVEVPNYIVEDLQNKTTRESVDKTSARISRMFDQHGFQDILDQTKLSLIMVQSSKRILFRY
jgi:hypothetical protein